MISPAEGVVKYTPRFDQGPLPAELLKLLPLLDYWRTQLRGRQLIGVGEDGIGYGNLSIRDIYQDGPFLITATQTAQLKTLESDHYALVTDYNLDTNELSAYGPFMPPSSEALTHAVLYEDSTVGAVVHVHDRYSYIWRNSKELGLASTDPEIEYGTPEMAREMQRLIDNPRVRETGILAMAGHKDGIISFGGDITQATRRMIDFYDEVYFGRKLLIAATDD
jgi:L-ribulose-5-phosphate 4-epimerase